MLLTSSIWARIDLLSVEEKEIQSILEKSVWQFNIGDEKKNQGETKLSLFAKQGNIVKKVIVNEENGF